MDINDGLASMVQERFDKKAQGSSVNNKIKQNEQLAEELHKPIIKKFKRRKLYSSLKTMFGVLILQICY